MKRTFLLFAAALLLTACEKAILDDEGGSAVQNGNVRLAFHVAQNSQVQAASNAASLSDYFTKLNVMLFDEGGNRAFSTVKTQTAGDSGFGTLAMQLTAGAYTIVAVGHSSAKSATIKSPQLVQFTAQDGEKLTDTFSVVGEVEVGDEPEQHTLTLQRVCAMVRFRLTDETFPDQFARLKIDYTGGSANFNPTTLEGTTKSSQSENRQCNDAQEYRVYTFPYQAESGTLKMILSALTADGTVMKQRTLENVPVARNRITTYTGRFFDEGDSGEITQETFTFTVNGEWDGEEEHTF